MTITIEPTDFGQDIVDMITPLAESLGLMENGEININDWDLKKALGFLETYDRTDKVVDLLSMISGGIPENMWREAYFLDESGSQKTSGTIRSDTPNDLSNYINEEWFKIYDLASWQGGSCAIFITVVHRTGSFNIDGKSSNHQLNIGIGANFNQQLNTNTPQDIEGIVSIPIVRLGWDASANNGEGGSVYENLIWLDESSVSSELASEGRISISAELKNSNDSRYETPNLIHPSCSNISLRAAVGNGGARVMLGLNQFKADSSSNPEDMIIDSWSDVGDVASSIIDGVISSLIDKVSGSSTITHNLLPMIGLKASPDTDLGINWPTIDLLNIVKSARDTKANGGVNGATMAAEELVNELRDFLSKLVQLSGPNGKSGAKVWLQHLKDL